MVFLQFVKKIMQGVAAVGLVAASAAQAVTLDLLVVYDQYSANYFNGQPEVAMRAWVAQINNAYVDSKIDVQLRLVGVEPHEDASTDMGAVLSNLMNDRALVSRRDQLGADFVTQLHQSAKCGLGYITVDRVWAWNVVGPDCGALTMAHELGHNMGLAHSRLQGDVAGARYNYAMGHGVQNLFATIMTYDFLYNAPLVAKFSNPIVDCLGSPCGVPAGQPGEADSALAINNVKTELAAFRPTVIPMSSSASSLASSAPASSSSSSASVVVVSSSSASSSSKASTATGTAMCKYTVTNQWNTGFTATISITNQGTKAINGWEVSWKFADSSRLTTNAWSAVFSGSNPYSAKPLWWNTVIEPGRSVEFGFQASKAFNAPAPTSVVVSGSICK